MPSYDMQLGKAREQYNGDTRTRTISFKEYIKCSLYSITESFKRQSKHDPSPRRHPCGKNISGYI
jgi:hypothetical protein